jgi:D-alanyl-D-alanine carboxypeptidase-like protein
MAIPSGQRSSQEQHVMRPAVGLALSVLASAVCGPPAFADPALDALVAAYPDHLASHDGKDLVWKDGTRMPISDGRTGKSFQQLLDAPDIKDQFAYPYPLGPDVKQPAENEDPGRIRYEPFFVKMYGDCKKGEVTKRMKPVAWMPGRGGGKLSVTSVNGVDERLAAVVKDLDTLPATMTKYLVPSAGTFNCRTIANTKRLSVHAFAAAIDINDKQADYWEFLKDRSGNFTWRNRVPDAIGDIFEHHGFVWGAKWRHVDSMHFEYRPELIALAKQSAK